MKNNDCNGLIARDWTGPLRSLVLERYCNWLYLSAGQVAEGVKVECCLLFIFRSFPWIDSGVWGSAVFQLLWNAY